jgi:hypothetical protein
MKGNVNIMSPVENTTHSYSMANHLSHSSSRHFDAPNSSLGDTMLLKANDTRSTLAVSIYDEQRMLWCDSICEMPKFNNLYSCYFDNEITVLLNKLKTKLSCTSQRGEEAICLDPMYNKVISESCSNHLQLLYFDIDYTNHFKRICTARLYELLMGKSNYGDIPTSMQHGQSLRSREDVISLLSRSAQLIRIPSGSSLTSDKRIKIANKLLFVVSGHMESYHHTPVRAHIRHPEEMAHYDFMDEMIDSNVESSKYCQHGPGTVLNPEVLIGGNTLFQWRSSPLDEKHTQGDANTDVVDCLECDRTRAILMDNNTAVKDTIILAIDV